MTLNYIYIKTAQIVPQVLPGSDTLLNLANIKLLTRRLRKGY
jgi:hypothetical protein